MSTQLRRSYIEITQKSPANAANSCSRGLSQLHHSYMANKEKDTERTEEEKAFNAKLMSISTRARALAEEILHTVILSELWQTIPESNRLYWLDSTCFPFECIRKDEKERNTDDKKEGEAWKWV